MDSHEENLANMIKNSKIEEAKQRAREEADRLKKEKTDNLNGMPSFGNRSAYTPRQTLTPDVL